MENIALDIGLVVISSAFVAVLLYFLRQPLVLAYILAGIAIGPFGFGLVHDAEFIHGVATIGVMLMLFLVGLEMNTSRLKDLGPIALVAGVAQVIFTATFGFLMANLFGFDLIESIYIAIALSFSSTVIAVKLMSDKKDTNSLYGQICIGILIVQDVLAILALLLLAGFQEGSFAFDLPHFASILAKGSVLAFLAIFASKNILKLLYSKIATSHELLILFSLSWCFLVSLLSAYVGFSIEIGAFIAGISLANLPYTLEINSKAKVLRDFFITIFFVALGTSMIFNDISSLIFPLLVLSAFVLIGNPIIVMTVMGLMGYDKRTSFLAGLNIANISEFSLIVVALGTRLGHLDEKITSMAAILAMITMVFSSYMITYNNQLYNLLKKYLSIFEFNKKEGLPTKIKKLSNHIILFGCGQMGEQVVEQILAFKDDYVVVDYNNQVIKKLIKKKINCVFGDAEDDDLLKELGIEDAELIISTLPSAESNYFLLRYLKEIPEESRPIVIAVAASGREGMDIFAKGVDYVIMKHYLGAHHIHEINKEIYQISDELKNVPVFRNIVAKKHSSDNEVASVLHNLNNLRLKEIKNKIEKKKLNLTSNLTKNLQNKSKSIK